MESEFSEHEVDSQVEIQETRKAGCTPKPKPESICVLLLLLCTIVTLMFLKMPKSSVFLRLSEIHVDCLIREKLGNLCGSFKEI